MLNEIAVQLRGRLLFSSYVICEISFVTVILRVVSFTVLAFPVALFVFMCSCIGTRYCYFIVILIVFGLIYLLLFGSSIIIAIGIVRGSRGVKVMALSFPISGG